MSNTVLIIGAGLAGLSAALTAAENGCAVTLISTMPSERAQSVMAEGGINAALNTKDEDDSPDEHYRDTIEAGTHLADPEVVRGMVDAAPGIVERLLGLGTIFTQDGYQPDLRSFGGQKKKRTLYSRSSTGKQIMTALIQAVRRYEAQGPVRRHTHHSFVRLIQGDNSCCGCIVMDTHTSEFVPLAADSTIIATGGMHGLFGNTTGSLDNTGAVTAELFCAGIPIANGEFIQYHPTTAAFAGKRLLISEAVRGEGGRLFVYRDGAPYYFMEEEYPELGNLAPRDMLSREIWQRENGGDAPATVYLDMRHLPDDVLNSKLLDVVEDCRTYLRLDPKADPIPVTPGIHYFMGGIKVDRQHRTKLPGLYAAGECCCQYHGANRLGGNSLLGAIYGGMVAAQSAMQDDAGGMDSEQLSALALEELKQDIAALHERRGQIPIPTLQRELRQTLMQSLGIVRDGQAMQAGVGAINALREKAAANYDPTSGLLGNLHMESLCLLGKGLLVGAVERKESRGAHYRSDYPAQDDSAFQKTAVVERNNGVVSVHFDAIPL